MSLSQIQLTPEEAAELLARQEHNLVLRPLGVDAKTGVCTYETHPFTSKAARDAQWALMDFLAEMNRKRAYTHPMYARLVRRVARAEASMGKYCAKQRRYEKSVLYTVGHPYEKNDYYPRVRAAKRVAAQMIADVYPQPWPGECDMLADLYLIARDDVDARHLTRV